MKLICCVVALALAGCLTFGPNSVPDPKPNPVRTALERDNRAILERAVKCDAWWPDYLGWGGSGSSRGGPDACFERNYHYQFRCVKDESKCKVSGEGWLLPSAEYPRVIDATHLAMCELIMREGGTVTHNKKSGSTFELDYTIGSVAGRLRGRIGPMDPPLNAPPNYKQDYTSLAVDFREENAPKK